LSLLKSLRRRNNLLKEQGYRRCGAIYEQGNGSIAIGGASSTVTFDNNLAGGNGGAVYGQNGGVTILGGDITLSGNTATTGNGGALYAQGNGGETIGGSGSTVHITGNQAGTNGGAIYAQNGPVTINGDVTLSGNTAASGAGIARCDSRHAQRPGRRHL
jgi:predicted outer membrane repeat protein